MAAWQTLLLQDSVCYVGHILAVPRRSAGFALPRPHVYQPALELFPSYGFAFLNLPIALWSCLGVLVWHVQQEFTQRWVMRVWVGLFAWLSFASFYSGSAFLSDLATGALVGALVAWHIIRLDLKPGVNVEPTLL